MSNGLLGGCVPAYERRLRSLREQGDFESAGRLLRDAEAAQPQDPIIVRERGILAFEQGNAEDAIPLLERAIALDPRDARAALYLGAANERAGQWDEAAASYLHAEMLWESTPALGNPASIDLAKELSCRRQAVETRSLATLVASKLAAERDASLPQDGRILFLPFEATGGEPAMSLRLGFAALLASDWERTPGARPVPFAECLAFLDALEVPLDKPIDRELRTRLARLMGARYVVDGRMSEVNENVSVAANLINLDAEGGPQEQRLEYLESRIGTLIDLEKKLVFQLLALQHVALSPEQRAALGEFATADGDVLRLYGEALRLLESGDRATALERLEQAVSMNAGFRPAREKQLLLTYCPSATVGDPQALVGNYESGLRAEAENALQRQLLSETTDEAGRLGGPEGEGKNLSINRPAGAGSVGISVTLPR